jgi:hypothetical protein
VFVQYHGRLPVRGPAVMGAARVDMIDDDPRRAALATRLGANVVPVSGVAPGTYPITLRTGQPQIRAPIEAAMKLVAPGALDVGISLTRLPDRKKHRGNAEIAAGGMDLQQRDPVSAIPERGRFVSVDAIARARASKDVGVGHIYKILFTSRSAGCDHPESIELYVKEIAQLDGTNVATGRVRYVSRGGLARVCLRRASGR